MSVTLSAQTWRTLSARQSCIQSAWWTRILMARHGWSGGQGEERSTEEKAISQGLREKLRHPRPHSQVGELGEKFSKILCGHPADPQVQRMVSHLYKSVSSCGPAALPQGKAQTNPHLLGPGMIRSFCQASVAKWTQKAGRQVQDKNFF